MRSSYLRALFATVLLYLALFFYINPIVMMDHLNQQQQQEQQSQQQHSQQQRYTKLWDSALGLNKNINAHNYIKKESFFNKNLMK